MTTRVALLAATCLPWHRFGGLERHVFQLASWLRERGVEVDLYLSAPEHDVDPFAGDAGFRLEIVPGTPFARRRGAVVISRSTLYPLFSLRMGRRVVAAAKSRAYAAVIAQGLTGFGYATLAGRRPTPPLVLNPQGMEEAMSPSAWKHAAYAPFRALTRFAARRAGAVVATDAVLVDSVERILGVERARIATIPNAIDVRECLALVDAERGRRVRERLGIADASPLLVTVGRIAPNKGLDVGLEAIAAVEPQLPRGWAWLVVGEGPRRRELERLAGERGFGDRVRFAGSLGDRDMHSVLASADLFFNPTLFEGSSLVTLEAMSHARAVVATRAGGIPDKVEEGVTGWLAESGDPGSLAAAVLRWHTAPADVRLRIGEAAYARCRERFDWPVCVDRYLETIRGLG